LISVEVLLNPPHLGKHDVMKRLLQEPVVGWAGAYRWVRYSYSEMPTVKHSCESST
jgi:hypothetical protein